MGVSNTSIPITNSGSGTTYTVSNGTNYATVSTANTLNTVWTTPQPDEVCIRLAGNDAKISFDGVELTKEDVELLHLLLAKLKGKLAQKRASEKELTDAVNDAVKELAN